MQFTPDSEPTIRLTVFLGVLALMALAELIAPRRSAAMSRPQRWLTNLTIVGINTLLVRLMAMLAVPVVAIAAAAFAEGRGLGLLISWDCPPGSS
jgi:hypothetical protein